MPTKRQIVGAGIEEGSSSGAASPMRMVRRTTRQAIETRDLPGLVAAPPADGRDQIGMTTILMLDITGRASAGRESGTMTGRVTRESALTF